MSSNPISSNPSTPIVVKEVATLATNNTFDNPPSIPNTKEVPLGELLKTVENCSTARSKPRDAFRKTLTDCVKVLGGIGALMGFGVGAIPGGILGLIIGALPARHDRNEEAKFIVAGNEFKVCEEKLNTAIGSESYLAKVTLLSQSNIALHTKPENWQSVHENITDIKLSKDEKILQFTIAVYLDTKKDSCRSEKIKKVITVENSDVIDEKNYKKVIFSAIVKNEIKENKEFKDYYTPWSTRAYQWLMTSSTNQPIAASDTTQE